MGAGPALAAGLAMVTDPVSDVRTISMPGSMPAAIGLSRDQGALPSGRVLQHLTLALKRSPASQAALDALVEAQLDHNSPSFHQWITPATLRADYAPAEADIQATIGWLQSHGLSVNSVSPTGMSIDFSGTAGHVAAAFHTALHAYSINGEAHLGPSGVPAIPAALSPVVQGVMMSNFFPRPQIKHARALPASTMAAAKIASVGSSYTATVQGTTFYAVTPSDFATIYNENELFQGAPAAGEKITGAGQTIVVAEQTDINRADWNTFRSTFKLTGYKGKLQFSHPGGCADPGMTGDEDEAALDAEWASATAPDATIIEASCSGAGSEFEFGVMVTLQNLVELGTPAASISVSYGGCEQGDGLVFLKAWEALVEEGAAEGISIFVSTGDDAVAGCDPAGGTPNAAGTPVASGGLAVNGLASNPYDTAVGGTDFQDTALGKNSTYWASANSSSGGSALSYIPEIPWDNDCANSIIWKFYGSSGPIQDCNKPPTSLIDQNVVGGSGGQSLVYKKPSWQLTSVPGVPNDGVRDLPDISLFAANGIWNHFYLYCMSDANEGGVPCTYTNATDFFGSAAGGTSFSAPDFAGIAALVAQVDGKVGNFAPRLYKIASIQFKNALLAKNCNSSNGAAVSRVCVFNDVTKGDNAVSCASGSLDCFSNSNSTANIGVISVTPKTLTPAFPTATGYDLATGLGTVNVTNLILSYGAY